jgi:hypothetical protein
MDKTACFPPNPFILSFITIFQILSSSPPSSYPTIWYFTVYSYLLVHSRFLLVKKKTFNQRSFLKTVGKRSFYLWPTPCLAGFHIVCVFFLCTNPVFI